MGLYIEPEQQEYIQAAAAAGYTEHMYRKWCMDAYNRFKDSYLIHIAWGGLPPCYATFHTYVVFIPGFELTGLGI